MNTETLSIFLEGGRVVASLVCALLFLKLKRRSGDRLYLAFSVAFVLLAFSTTILVLGVPSGEGNALVFLPRLLGFGAIIAGVVDRNRRARGARSVRTKDSVHGGKAAMQ